MLILTAFILHICISMREILKLSEKGKEFLLAREEGITNCKRNSVLREVQLKVKLLIFPYMGLFMSLGE